MKWLNILLVLLCIAGLGVSIFVLQKYSQDTEALKSQVATLEKERDSAVSERDKNIAARDKVRNVWEDQTAINDEIILVQTTTEQYLNDYFRIFDTLIKADENGISIISQTNTKEFASKRKELEQKLLELEKATGKNAQFKTTSKSEIDQLYRDLEADQQNRAKPQQ